MGVGEGEDEHGEYTDEGNNGDEEEDEAAVADVANREGEEEGDVGELGGDAGGADDDDGHAVRLHGGDAVQHPQHAVEQRGVVRRRRVLLHRPILPDAVERGPAREREHAMYTGRS